MDSDWTRQSGMDKFLEMTRPKRSRRVWVGDELAIDWRERLSDAPKPSEFGGSTRKEGVVSRTACINNSRCGSAKSCCNVSLVSTENGGGWEPRGPFRLVGSGLTRYMCLVLRSSDAT